MYRRRDEIVFGSISGRELTLRWFIPWRFRKWTDDGDRLSWMRLLNPARWLRTSLSRESWAFWCKRFTYGSHRCYCDAGWMFDGRVVLCGFGLVWFYSHFKGDIPCPCDIAMADHFGCYDCGSLPTVEGKTQCAACAAECDCGQTEPSEVTVEII